MADKSKTNDRSARIRATLRARLQHLYGPRLTRAVLFGLRAREDSDYDVAVFLTRMDDRWAEFDRLDPILADLLLNDGAAVQVLPYHDQRYNDPSSLMRAIREDGILL